MSEKAKKSSSSTRSGSSRSSSSRSSSNRSSSNRSSGNSRNGSPPQSERIVKADEFSTLKNAKDLVATAEAEAAEIRKAAKKALEKARQEGYQQGIELARKQCLEQMIQTAEGCVDYVRSCESVISQLTVNAIEKIIGSCDHKRVTGHLIKQGLERMSSGDDLKIRVPSGRVSEYRALLEQIASPQTRIRLVESDSIENNECLLESSLGVVRLSLQDQVDELKKHVHSVLP